MFGSQAQVQLGLRKSLGTRRTVPSVPPLFFSRAIWGSLGCGIIVRVVMELRVVSLASSSVYGNAYLVGWGSTNVLVDCGVPIRRLEKSLQEANVDPHALAGVFVSHEHGDHIRSMQLKTPFPAKYNVPVYSSGLFWAAQPSISSMPDNLCATLEHGSSVQAGSLQVAAFRKSHDAVAPLGFRLTAPDGTSVAVVTDLGEFTPEVLSGSRDCDYLIFESNHDRAMELNSGRPWSLIKRVMGKYGHLSNDEAGEALAALVTERTKGIMLAHLSLDCNSPSQALRTITPWLRRIQYQGALTVASASAATFLTDSVADH